MTMRILAVVVALFTAGGTAAAIASANQRSASQRAASSFCGLDRKLFELLVSLRMQNYESTGDSWSSRAGRWRNEIAGNIAAGRPTPSLDAAFNRYGRYCAEDDAFMAGVTVGEWVGISLRAP